MLYFSYWHNVVSSISVATHSGYKIYLIRAYADFSFFFFVRCLPFVSVIECRLVCCFSS